MARTRTKKTVEAQLDTMFDDSGQAERLEAQVETELNEKAETKMAKEFPHQPKAPPDPRAQERAWESYPRVWGDAECPTCQGILRRRDDGLLVCKLDHVHDDFTTKESVAPHLSETLHSRPLPVHEEEQTPRESRAKVEFREHTQASKLHHLNYDDTYEETRLIASGLRFEDSFVKVSATLAPSERESFDANALKDRLRKLGARAVMVVLHSSAEAPTQEAKRETAAALQPADAIKAWFEGLPISATDKAEAIDKALAILAKEGG